MPRPLSQEARRKAVDAAQAIVAEQGVTSLTMDGVAKRSGVAKTTLYRHWGTSSQLLVHSIDAMIERVPTPNTGSIRGDLLELLSMFRSIANEPTHCRLFMDLMSAATTDPELATVQRSLISERSRPLREIVIKAMTRGEIPDIDPEQASTFIEGPLLARMIKSDEPIALDELPAIVNFVARGLGAPES